MSPITKVKMFMKEITVEPVLFFFMFASHVQYPVYQSLVFNKACLEKYTQLQCENLPTPDYKDVQDIASYWIQGSSYVLSVSSILSSTYLGSWSDSISRKLVLLFPLAGNVLCFTVLIYSSVFIHTPIWITLIGYFLAGITGGFVSVIMGVMSYTSQSTKAENRTFRISLLESMSFLGGCLGPFVNGYLVNVISLSNVLLFLQVMNVLAVIFALVLPPELPTSSAQYEQRNCCSKYFSIQHIKEYVTTCFKERPDNKRMPLLLLMSCSLLVMLCTSGEMDVAFLFSKKPPISIEFSTYNYYIGMKYLLSTSSLIIGASVLRYYGCRDTTMALVGITSKALGLLLLGSSYNVPMMFFVPVVGLFNSWVMSSIRSMLSKLVDQNEEGKMFACVASLENICTFLASLIFLNLYNWSAGFFSGLPLVFASTILVIPLGIMIFLRTRPNSMF